MATFHNYTGDGNATKAFSFPSIKEADVKVRVDGVLKTSSTHYNITSYTTTGGGNVVFTSGNIPASPAVIRIYRETDISAALATYVAGSSVKADDLNNNNKQLRFIAEENQNQLVQTFDTQDDAITTAKIAGDAVTGSEIADNAIDSEHYTDGSIDTVHIGDDQVTYSKIQNVSATDRILGRDSSGAGVIEEITPANLRTMINVEDGATADQSNAEIRAAVEAASDSNVFTDADHSKLNAIEASADVTDATNVNAAGAVMNSDTSTSAMQFVVDEDNMASNSATKVPSQQSVKAYVDSQAGGDSNQNAFSNVAVSGQTTVAADSTTDTLTFVAGTNVTITTDASADSVTINAAGGSSGLSAVVGDSTPQLGGDLDVQTSEINTSSTNGNIKLNPNGTGCVEIKGDGTSSGTTGAIQLNCSNNNHGVKIQSPAHSAGATYTLTLPVNDGDANQVLKTDGSGVLSWVAQTTDTNTQLSNAEVRTAVEAATDSNVFTDADHTKLNGIAASANAYVHPNHSGEVTSTADGATVIADNIVDEANLKVSNAPTNGYVLVARSGNTGGMTWEESPAPTFVLFENAHTLSADYTIGSGNNAMAAGPLTTGSYTVTVPSGSTFTIV